MDKTGMMLGYLVGRKIAGMRNVKREPVAYLYGHNQFPPLQEVEGYPYMVITYTSFNATAYAFAEPLTAELTTGILGNQLYSPVHKTPFLVNKFVNRSTSVHRSYWSGWEQATADTSPYLNTDNWWVNHDVVASDGTTPFPASSEPVPVYLPCVLFNEEVITEYGEYTGNYCRLTLPAGLAYGDVLGITFDGVYEEYTVEWKHDNNTFELFVGNRWLDDDSAEDDGRDLCIDLFEFVAHHYYASLTTRTAGTHRLKIELISMGQ